MLTLRSPPFSLDWGSSIYAKVVATNLYGDSLTSNDGNGAIIITYPDAPLNLVELESARTATSITFTWIEGEQNGGSTVFSYRVWSDNASGTLSVLDSGVAQTSYTATSLTAGLTYKFKVEAQNEFGYSEPSVLVQILCATYPEKPDTPVSAVIAD